MDPWRMLEDYNDTPFALQTFGGTRLDRASLTYVLFPPASCVRVDDASIHRCPSYAQLRVAPAAIPDQGVLKRVSESALHSHAPEETGGDVAMHDRSAAPPQAKVARV